MVVLGVTEGRQEVTFAAGCCVLLWIGILQHKLFRPLFSLCSIYLYVSIYFDVIIYD